ncbi:MAG: Allene oxide cyclase [Egibacteraceae bacterium]
MLTVLSSAAIAACGRSISGATTLRLVVRQTSINRVDNPPAGASATDLSTVIDDLFDAADEESVGRDEIACVAVTATDLQCTGTLYLPDGQLTFTMPYSVMTRSGEGAITGGTGAYQTAGGTFRAVARPDTAPMVSDYTLTITAS